MLQKKQLLHATREKHFGQPAGRKIGFIAAGNTCHSASYAILLFADADDGSWRLNRNDFQQFGQ